MTVLTDFIDYLLESSSTVLYSTVPLIVGLFPTLDKTSDVSPSLRPKPLNKGRSNGKTLSGWQDEPAGLPTLPDLPGQSQILIPVLGVPGRG